jgi:uncharacterized protein (DUF1684 family)
MIKRITCSVSFLLLVHISFAQNKAYKDSIEVYFKRYVREHEVVKGKDKELMSFFPADEKYLITCRFEKVNSSSWFPMETSGLIKKIYRVYGKVYFSINDTAVSLNIYQSQDLMATEKYRDHLFIPFTDATSGEETYAGGRYFDFEIKDIAGNKLTVDFNKAYNPYCAYVSGKYNCPIPPAENRLAVAIKAGEKAFAKPH